MIKKINKISYFYFITGLIISLYSIISQNKQVLNLDDTYYVIFGNDFALFVFLIYLVFGSLFLVIEKHLRFRMTVFQYLMFTIPYLYFVFSDLTFYNTPVNYLINPIAYKWIYIYIPVGLIICFYLSIILFIAFFVYAFFEVFQRKKG